MWDGNGTGNGTGTGTGNGVGTVPGSVPSRPVQPRAIPAGRLVAGHLLPEPGAVPPAGAPGWYVGNRYPQGKVLGGSGGATPAPICLPPPCPVAEVLVLGTGDRVERLHPAVLKQMRACGIAVEVQDTVRGTWGYPGGAGGLQGGGRGPFTLLTFFIFFPLPAQRLRHLQLPIDRRAPRSRRAHPPAGHLQGGLGAARLHHGLSASSLACQACRGCCAPPIAAPEGETLWEELEGVGRGRGCTAPGTLGGPPGEYTEWKYRALVWWLMHAEPHVPAASSAVGASTGLRRCLVVSLACPRLCCGVLCLWGPWGAPSSCGLPTVLALPLPVGLNSSSKGYGAGHRGDAAAVPGLQSGPGLALLSELAVLISVCH